MTDEETGLYEEDMYNDNGDCYLWQEEERLNKEGKMENNYSLKWDIEMSIEYKELLLNLFAQGYFDVLWKTIKLQDINATKVFVEELNKIQFEFLGDYVNEVYKKNKQGGEE